MIDAHLHFFDAAWPGGIIWPSPDKSYYGRKLPDDYLKASGEHRPLGVILVETNQREFEDQRLVSLARDHGFIKGFVANLRPLEDGFRTRLNSFRTMSKFKGIRLRPVDSYDLESPDLIDTLNGLSDTGLTLELGAKVPERIPQICALADRLPNVKIIVTHAGHPEIRGPEIATIWSDAMTSLAMLTNVWLKITPLTAFSESLEPEFLGLAYSVHMDFLVKIFGAGRLTYGSNWPVSEILGSPGEHFSNFAAALGQDESLIQEITEKSARRLYQLA